MQGYPADDVENLLAGQMSTAEAIQLSTMPGIATSTELFFPLPQTKNIYTRCLSVFFKKTKGKVFGSFDMFSFFVFRSFPFFDVQLVSSMTWVLDYFLFYRSHLTGDLQSCRRGLAHLGAGFRPQNSSCFLHSFHAKMFTAFVKFLQLGAQV